MKKGNSFCFSNAIEKVVKEREPLRQLFKSQRRTRQEERDSTGSKISAFNFFFFSCHANQGKGRHSSRIRLDRGLPLKDYASIFHFIKTLIFLKIDFHHLFSEKMILSTFGTWELTQFKRVTDEIETQILIKVENYKRLLQKL